ncbi:transcriptional regulator, GntR family [Frankia torreyi]|uniref:Transcriptional regulator, GntR family n=2 Tax=Frankiaceae TaxID=74712 RepID=A0A0D8BEI9_9ACTN|nr:MULTISPECIES: FCD domain-containing protein [Frankia]KJE22470.1 transcriptional regulator, GntR family [Frankia torreyi]KQM04508.1 transcriptional regulator, GntR family [Frankia sp. CpI1-P]
MAAGGPQRPRDAIGRRMRVPKMAELVASDLRQAIIRNTLAEGQALPPEAVLMGQYGVSRPTLREALRILEAESLITVRRGAGGGARVQSPNPAVAARYAGLVLEHRATTIADVWDARLLLEPPTAAALARRRTKADLRALRALLAEHDAATERVQGVRLHNEFHTLVVHLAGNETLALLITLLGEIINRTTWTRVEADLGTPELERAERGTVRVHAMLVDLVEAGDAAGAQDLWRRHLAAGARYLGQGGRDEATLDLLGRPGEPGAPTDSGGWLAG